jgi:hypothetical protein
MFGSRAAMLAPEPTHRGRELSYFVCELTYFACQLTPRARQVTSWHEKTTY